MTLIVCISCVAVAALLAMLRVAARLFGSLLWGCLAIVKWSAVATATSLVIFFLIGSIQPILGTSGLLVTLVVMAAFLWMTRPAHES